MTRIEYLSIIRLIRGYLEEGRYEKAKEILDQIIADAESEKKR